MKTALLRFYHSLDENINLKLSGSVLLWISSILITLYCITLLSLPLYRTAAPKGIVFATDNDGGRAIELSVKTRWYKSNSFAPYGNLYYRLSETLADFIPWTESSTKGVDLVEKTHHFSLKFVSLLSLFSLGFFLAFILFGITPEALLFASFFTLWSLRLPMWTTWIFRPHPDHLLLLFTGIAVYLFSRLLAKPEDRRIFILSAFSWGLAMAVKRSTAAFIPGILLFMLLPYKKEKLTETAKYIGYMLLAYLLIGFPQNFGFYKHIKFLLYESSLHSRTDGETLLSAITIIWNQLWVIMLPVLAASLFSQRREKNYSHKLLIFVLLGTVPVLMRKPSFPSDHHTMPLAVTFLILIMVAALHFNPWRLVQRRRLILIPLMLLLIKLTGIPESYSQMENIQLSCRTEMQKINELAGSKIARDFHLLREPFFPSNTQIEVFARTTWGIKEDDIDANTGFLGISTASYENYGGTAPPESFYGKMIEDWDMKHEFYTAIRNKDQFITKDGESFRRIFNGCGFELWEMVK